MSLSKEIKKLARHDGLLIDEMGYVQQSREEMEVLFTLLAERYERGSVLLTSNLPFSKWEEIFKDPMTTVAAIAVVCAAEICTGAWRSVVVPSPNWPKLLIPIPQRLPLDLRNKLKYWEADRKSV